MRQIGRKIDTQIKRDSWMSRKAERQKWTNRQAESGDRDKYPLIEQQVDRKMP